MKILLHSHRAEKMMMVVVAGEVLSARTMPLYHGDSLGPWEPPLKHQPSAAEASDTYNHAQVRNPLILRRVEVVWEAVYLQRCH